jgi:imidazolonepropionase-like amidohydrolase
MTTRLLLACALLHSATAAAWAHPFLPGAPQTRPIALVGGTIHPADGPVVQQGTLLFDAGRIVALGTDVALPPDALTIDVAGKHVYPGLFDAYTQLGLMEIPAVRATRDTAETGAINPNARAVVSVNPDSELIPVTRSGGVLTVLTVPSGGLISGRAAVMQLDGWTWEDMALRADAAMIAHWPATFPVRSWLERSPPRVQLEERNRRIDQLRQAFADARAYQAARQSQGSGTTAPGSVDVRWEAMLPVLRGQMPLLISADDVQQIQSAVAFAQREQIKLLVVGGYDAPLCADLLREHDVGVIVEGVHRLPLRDHDPYDAPFTLPARLHAAKVRFCISGNEDHYGNVRNLPYHAATAAAYGLPAEEALRAITLYPAQLLGVGDRTGSLAVGKDATLLVTDGDILEITTRVERAYIQGREVDLRDKQKLLWEKYQERLRRRAAP